METVEQLLERAGGPLSFRFFFMPMTVALLAARAGLQDAREGRPAFFWALLTNITDRRLLMASLVRDTRRVFIMAVLMDTFYQVAVLRAFHPAQMLIVALACAVVPYVLVRGPVTRLARRLRR